MTQKLTAKLSDGQEVELVPESASDRGQLYLLRPLNYKPEPPKEVWLNVYPAGDRLFYGDEKGANALGGEGRIGGKAHRYTLAPEPEQKKPREWWVVQWQGPFEEMVQCERQFECQADAACWAARILLSKPYEIFRVREVEE